APRQAVAAAPRASQHGDHRASPQGVMPAPRRISLRVRERTPIRKGKWRSVVLLPPLVHFLGELLVHLPQLVAADVIRPPQACRLVFFHRPHLVAGLAVLLVGNEEDLYLALLLRLVARRVPLVACRLATLLLLRQQHLDLFFDVQGVQLLLGLLVSQAAV